MGSNASAIKTTGVAVTVGADNSQLLAKLSQSEKRVKAFGTAIASVGKQFVGFGLALAAPLVASTKVFADYESQLASLRAAANPTAEELLAIESAIKEIGKETGAGPAAVASAMTELLKAGLPLESVLRGTTAAAIKFARVAEMDVAEAAVVLTDAMNVFGKTAEEASNAISRAADASSISVKDVAMSFSMVSAVAKMAGLSIEETAAAIAVLGKNGVKGSDAGTSLKTMLLRLQTGAGTAGDTMKDLGINVRKGNGQMKSMRDIIAELRKKLGGLSAQARDTAMYELFGTDAIRAGVILLNEGTAGWDAFNAKMAEGLPVSQKYAILMNTLSGFAEQTWASIQRLAVAIGTALAPMLGAISKRLTTVTGALEAFIKNNQELVVTFAKGLAIFMALSGALLAVGSVAIAASVAIQGLGLALGLVISVFGVMQAAVLGVANPISLLITVARTFVSAFLRSGKSTSEFFAPLIAGFLAVADLASWAFGAVVKGALSVASSVGSAFAAIPGAVSSAFTELVSAGASAFAWIRGEAGAAATGFAQLFPVVTAAVRGAISIVAGAFSILSAGLKVVGFWADLAFTGLSVVAKYAFMGISVVARNAFGIIQGIGTIALKLIGGAFSLLGTIVSGVFGLIRAVVSGVFRGIASIAGAAFRAVATVVGAVFSAIASVAQAAFGVVASVAGAVFSRVASIARSAFGAIYSAASRFVSWILGVFPDIVSVAQIAFRLIVGTIKNVGAVASGAFGILRSVVSNTFGFIANTISSVPGWISSAFSTAGEIVSSLFGSIAGFAQGIGEAFVSLPETLSSVFGQVASGLSSALESLGALFGKLKETALSTFGGISDALKSGDISLAAKILWAGLKVAFVEGSNFLKALWADWGVAMIDAFRGVSFSIAGFLVDAFANIQIGFIKSIGFIQDGWSNLIGYLMKAWNTFGGFFAKVWERVKSIFKGEDVQVRIDKINQDVAAQNAAVDQGTEQVVGDRKQDRDKKIGQLKTDQGVARQAITDQQKAEAEARRAAAQEGLAGDAAALSAAKGNLQSLIDEAKKKATEVPAEAVAAAVGKSKDQLLTPEGVDAGIAQAKAKVDVAGSFSASALKGLGVGDSVSDAVKEGNKEAKKQTEQLSKLNRNVERAGSLT